MSRVKTGKEWEISVYFQEFQRAKRKHGYPHNLGISVDRVDNWYFTGRLNERELFSGIKIGHYFGKIR